jgi:putative SOS response-associated peptidase YedK
MCGRINVSDHKGIQQLLEWLELPLFPDKFVPRYNIAPGSSLLAAARHNADLELSKMDWGIIPVWAKPDQFSRPLINARAESIWDKPSFKNLVATNRAVVPVNGFYEWKRNGKNKTPYYVHSPENLALALGAIYQISKNGILQCCIVTTAANHTMGKIHDRMPVMLPPEKMKDWLCTTDKSEIEQLMLPATNNAIQLTPISNYVNNAQHEGPECLKNTNKQSDLFS